MMKIIFPLQILIDLFNHQCYSRSCCISAFFIQLACSGTLRMSRPLKTKTTKSWQLMYVCETNSLIFLWLMQFQEISSEAANFLPRVGRCEDSLGAHFAPLKRFYREQKRSGFVSLIHQK